MEQGGSFRDLAEEIVGKSPEDVIGVLVVVVGADGSGPGKVGAKMLVHPDGEIRGTIGGGVIEARVIADALNALEDGLGPRTQRYELAELGMACGGELSVYIEPLVPPRRVLIFGGGHVGAAIARQLKLLGCEIFVIDERSEWANRERFPEADRIVNRPFQAYLEEEPPTSRDHVIIVTRGHNHDQVVLEGTIQAKPAYLGMIGSQKKANQALARLRERGVAEDLIAAVRTPIGLDIGAVTPEEIAVSVAAEMVQLWRRKTRSSTAEAREAPPLSAEAAPEQKPRPVPIRPVVRPITNRKED